MKRTIALYLGMYRLLHSLAEDMSPCHRLAASPTTSRETAHTVDRRCRPRAGLGSISLHHKRTFSLPTCFACLTTASPCRLKARRIKPLDGSHFPMTQRDTVSGMTSVSRSVVLHVCCINTKELLLTVSTNSGICLVGSLTSESFMF